MTDLAMCLAGTYAIPALVFLWLYFAPREMTMAWKKGPLPKDTWGWGAIVKCGEEAGMGFYFADFQGDHVLIGDSKDREKVEANMVAKYDNSITIPDAK